MADGIRLDLQRALSEGPGSIPNLEPLFAPGAIPPIFEEAPEVGLNDVGIDLETGQGTFSGVPMDVGQASIGQPVPPVKASRGDRLRALLGNFLQNFGTGLQAASRAPSGAEFAAGFGGALSAGEERRQQKSREDLLRANQASREQQVREIQELRESQFAFQQQQAEAGRIERENVRAGAERRRFQDILSARTQRTADIVAGRRARVGQREFLRGQQKRTREAIAAEGKLNRQLQRDLAKLRGTPGDRPLTPAQALTQARLEVAEITKADALKLGKDRLFVGEEGLKRLQQVINERATFLLGRKATTEETKEIFNPRKVASILADIKQAKKANFTDDDLTALVVRFFLAEEINSLERDKIMEEAGLAPETLSEVELFRRNIGRREQIEESREKRIPGTLPSFLRKIR
jgi:hypothetical protein